jgi:hypothetical protein
MNDYSKIKKISMCLFFLANLWIMVGYILLVNASLYFDCYISSWNDELYCYTYNQSADTLVILPIIYSFIFPLVYWVFYYPLKSAQDFIETLKIKEVRYLPIPNLMIQEKIEPTNQVPTVIIKNFNVQDSVVTEE